MNCLAEGASRFGSAFRAARMLDLRWDVIASCVLLIGSLLSSRPAIGQSEPSSPGDPFAGVEEMIVTGSGVGDLLNATTTASIGFDTKDLLNIGVEDVSDLASYVPNLEIATVNATNASFFVRGVGLQDFGANASSSVPIFQDGISRNASATQLVGLFDIARLDVLKGPQGSGNLRNASAGAFLVRTNAPEPEFSGTARMTLAKIVSVDARDANRYSFDTAMNAPVYEDIVSARISARYSHENPFWENRCANRTPIEDRPVRVQGQSDSSAALCGELVQVGFPSRVTPFLPRWVGEVDDYGVRGQIRIKPPDQPIDWTIRAEMSNLNRDSTTGQHLGTGAGFVGQADVIGYRDRDLSNRQAFIEQQLRARDPSLTNAQLRRLARVVLAKEVYKDPLDRRPYAGDINDPGRTLLETHTISTTAVLDLEEVEMTANFGYVDYRKSEGRDTDLSPNSRFASRGDDQAWEYYGDLAFKGDEIAGLPIEWNTGLYSLTEQVEASNSQVLFAGSSTPGTIQQVKFEQEIYSFGLYAEGNYEFLESFNLGAGVRYNWEQKDFDIDNQSFASRNQRTWDAVTGFVNLEYHFTEDISTYMKYSRGFKAGHFNPSDAGAARVPGEGFADPEQIDSFEWGLKASAWANRITGSGTFFFYNYDNYQVFRLTTNFQGVSRVVQNAEQARNYGAEIEIIASPLEGFVPEEIEGLSITLRGGWLEAEFVEFSVTEQRLFQSGSLGVAIDYSGNTLLNSANLQASAIFAWPVVLDRWGTFTPQYDFTWTDDTPFDPNNGRGEPLTTGDNIFPPYLLGNRAYMLHNVRMTWAPPGDPGIQLSGWCRNLTDERYKTFAVDLSTFSSQQLAYVADPRLCGADLRFTW